MAGRQEMAKLNWSNEKVDHPSWIIAEVRLMVVREDTASSTPSPSRLPCSVCGGEGARQSRALPELILEHW